MESRTTAGGVARGGGWSKKEGLMDTDITVVIAGGRGRKGDKW